MASKTSGAKSRPPAEKRRSVKPSPARETEARAEGGAPAGGFGKRRTFVVDAGGGREHPAKPDNQGGIRAALARIAAAAGSLFGRR